MSNSWATLKRILDRPSGRVLLGIVVSLRLTLKLRRATLVHWHDGTWVHRWRGTAIPDPVVGAAPPPDIFTAEARDIYIHGYVPQSGDLVFDVGAGIGETSLLFSELVGNTGRVIAIEAHPETFARLKHLCRLNRINNVTAFHFVASESDGEVSLSNHDDYVSNTIIDSGDGATCVRSRPLDDLAAELGIQDVALLKMNIEGAERSALAGMGSLLSRTRHVCVGCHDFLADRGGSDQLRTKASCVDLLTLSGFNVTSREDAPQPWVRDYLYGTRDI